MGDYQQDQTGELEQLRDEARRLGIDLSAKGAQGAIAARRQRAEDLAVQRAQGPEANERDVFGWFEWLAGGVGDALNLALVVLLRSVMLPLGIIGLAVVEAERVIAGVALFDPARAGLMGIVLVSFYMILLMVRAHLEVAAHGSTARVVPSLRVWAGNAAYRLGIEPAARLETPVQQVQRAAGAVFWVIMLLGTAGSMGDKLRTVGGAWYEALGAILTGSSLVDALTYLGGFLFTFALLRASHWAVNYAYEQYVRMRPVVVETGTAQEAADAAEAEYVRVMIEKKRQALTPRPPLPQGEGEQASEGRAANPTMAAPAMSHYGNGNGRTDHHSPADGAGGGRWTVGG